LNATTTPTSNFHNGKIHYNVLLLMISVNSRKVDNRF
jgi:hypothetical protein